MKLRGAGQNARLAAKLTGYKIDIKPESAPEEELAEDELLEEESAILEDESFGGAEESAGE